jgi:hypothetical protein
MSTHFYWLVIGILVVWRITHLFYGEDGPWDVFTWLRRSVGEGFWGSLLDCFYCLSLWVALPLAYWLGESWKQRILLWLALSSGAIMLERLTAKDEPKSEIQYIEHEEHDDVLRQEQNAITDRDSRPIA